MSGAPPGCGNTYTARRLPTAVTASPTDPARRSEGGRGKESALAIRGARILPSPDAPPIEQGTVLVRSGRIEAVGAHVPIPPGAEEISAEGKVLTAGFWNAHVHFSEAKWRNSDRRPSAILEAHLHDMLTSRGFSTVVDLGSDPRGTLPLRRRIESGEVLGPRILTAGPGLYPPHGIPHYLRDSIPFWVRWRIPQPTSPRAARRVVERMLGRGGDLVKLFTGSYVERGRVVPMPDDVARSAVEAAHAQGRLVFSHPSNLEGTRVAARAGVDVLAHPPDTTEGVDRSVVQELIDRRMGLTPTLQMFATTVTTNPEYLQPIYEVVRQFRELGGSLLFGTDVGYMTDYDTTGEFLALARCGLDGRSILRTLTTAPAARFGVTESVGTVEVGKRADLVLLDEDPYQTPTAFANVRATIRAGEILHHRP